MAAMPNTKRWRDNAKAPIYYTTAEICRITRLHPTTLERWITHGHLPEPGRTADNRVWTKADLARVKKLKREIYREDLAAAGRKAGAIFRAGAEAARKAESAQASA